MSSFVILGITAAVVGVVFVLIELGLKKGADHVIGGIALEWPVPGVAWHKRVRNRIAQGWRTVRSGRQKTVYVDQLYAEYHPRISAMNKAIHGRVTR